jgi:hypothetical protein
VRSRYDAREAARADARGATEPVSGWHARETARADARTAAEAASWPSREAARADAQAAFLEGLAAGAAGAAASAASAAGAAASSRALRAEIDAALSARERAALGIASPPIAALKAPSSGACGGALARLPDELRAELSARERAAFGIASPPVAAALDAASGLSASDGAGAKSGARLPDEFLRAALSARELAALGLAPRAHEDARAVSSSSHDATRGALSSVEPPRSPGDTSIRLRELRARFDAANRMAVRAWPRGSRAHAPTAPCARAPTLARCRGERSRPCDPNPSLSSSLPALVPAVPPRRSPRPISPAGFLRITRPTTTTDVFISCEYARAVPHACRVWTRADSDRGRLWARRRDGRRGNCGAFAT